jgi:Domain of unknown function (DUF4331)
MSDHFSGPRALAGPAGDVTDVYAFPSPERPGHLVMVINVLPLAQPATHFSDAIDCRLRLRPLTITGAGADAAFRFGAEEEELAFTVGFAAPLRFGADAAVQEGWCTASSGETARFAVHDERGGSVDGMRVFAGLRADPFAGFIDTQAIDDSVNAGRLMFTRPGNPTIPGADVLSVVIEVDARPWLNDGRGPLFGIVGETVAAGKLPIRIERFGRPEIKNVILGMKQFDAVNRDLEVRDLYNLEDAFHMSGDYRPVYRARMNANLAMYDRLDGKTDWKLGPDGGHPLTELLLDDYMVVDVTKPFAADSFFEIETAMLQGRSHETCGGRWLNDDVMDTLLTLMVAGLDGGRVDDGIDGPSTPATMTFPYLATPNLAGIEGAPPAPPSGVAS